MYSHDTTHQENALKGVRSRPERQLRPRVRISLNRASERNLRTVEKFYREQAGSEVSVPLILRRGLELLAERVTEVWKDRDKVMDEMSAVMRQMN